MTVSVGTSNDWRELQTLWNAGKLAVVGYAGGAGGGFYWGDLKIYISRDASGIRFAAPTRINRCVRRDKLTPNGVSLTDELCGYVGPRSGLGANAIGAAVKECMLAWSTDVVAREPTAVCFGITPPGWPGAFSNYWLTAPRATFAKTLDVTEGKLIYMTAAQLKSVA